MQLFACGDGAQGLDEHTPLLLLGLAIGVAGVVDPARGVAAIQRVDHAPVLDVEVEGVLRIAGVVRMAPLRFVPTDALAHVLDHGLALGNVLHGKNATPMHRGAAGLDAALGGFHGEGGKKFGMVNCVCARVGARG